MRASRAPAMRLALALALASLRAGDALAVGQHGKSMSNSVGTLSKHGQKHVHTQVHGSKTERGLSYENSHKVVAKSNFLASFGGRARESDVWWGRWLTVAAFLVAIIVIGAACFTSTGIGRAKRLFLLVEVLNYMNYSACVPDSLQVARLLGADSTFSGWMISAFTLGSFLSTIGLWTIYRRSPVAMVRKWTMTLVRLAVFVMLCCTIANTYILWKISTSATPSPSLKWLALAMRFLLGLPSGVGFVYSEAFAMLLSPEDRPGAFALLKVGLMLGLGLGPIFAGGSHLVLDDLNPGPHVVEPSIALLVVQVLVLAFLMLPGIDLESLRVHFTESSASSAPDGPRFQVAFLSLCITFSGLRAIATSGVEAATTMILEGEFHWESVSVGIAIGLTFLVSIPLRFALDSLAGRGLGMFWTFRACMALALLGALFVGSWACAMMQAMWHSFRSCPLLVPLGDSLLLPAFYAASGLMDGVIVNNVSPKGLLTRESALMMNLSVVDVGRILGPPIAGTILQSHDSAARDKFASIQFALALLGWALAEGMRACRPWAFTLGHQITGTRSPASCSQVTKSSKCSTPEAAD